LFFFFKIKFIYFFIYKVGKKHSFLAKFQDLMKEGNYLFKPYIYLIKYI